MRLDWVKCSAVVLIILSCLSAAKVSNLKRSKVSARAVVGGEDRSERESDPFEQMAQFLIQCSKKGKGKGKGKAKGELDGYSDDEVRRSVKKLAAGQETLKSMDGAAHQLKSTFSDRFSCLTSVS